MLESWVIQARTTNNLKATVTQLPPQYCIFFCSHHILRSSHPREPRGNFPSFIHHSQRKYPWARNLLDLVLDSKYKIAAGKFLIGRVIRLNILIG